MAKVCYSAYKNVMAILPPLGIGEGAMIAEVYLTPLGQQTTHNVEQARISEILIL
jgi:hypothetical protein